MTVGPMSGLRYDIVDVFTDRAYAGNPLAVVHGGTELSTGRMQAIAGDRARSHAHARMFAPGAGVAEDPATGSAALGLGVWLVGNGWLPGDDTSAYTVHQGVEMHRPSRLECTVTAVAGAATVATVSGGVVPVARGEIAVPPFVG